MLKLENIPYIGIAGQLANGKNSLADSLEEALNNSNKMCFPKWSQTSFAGSVKQCYCDYFGKDLAFIEHWKRNPEPPPGMSLNVRKSLQWIGDGFRQIKSDIWIETCFRLNKAPFIITDMRYHNEARAVHERGGVNILVYRPGFTNDDPNPSESQLRPLVDWCVATNQEGPIVSPSGGDRFAVYAAPEGLEHYDFFVPNHGTLSDLQEYVYRRLVDLLVAKDRSIARERVA